MTDSKIASNFNMHMHAESTCISSRPDSEYEKPPFSDGTATNLPKKIVFLDMQVCVYLHLLRLNCSLYSALTGKLEELLQVSQSLDLVHISKCIDNTSSVYAYMTPLKQVSLPECNYLRTSMSHNTQHCPLGK